MVKTQASILLLVLSFNIFAPLVPWLEYAVNYEFIVKNLCVQKNEEVNTCNGMCHLKENIEKQEDANKDKKQHIPTFKTFQVEPVVIQIMAPILNYAKETNHLSRPYFIKYNYQFISEYFHPPKYCLSMMIVC